MFFSESLHISAQYVNQHTIFACIQLYHFSEDQELEKLIDASVREILYGECQSLWTNKAFVELLYSDDTYSRCVQTIYEKMQKAGQVMTENGKIKRMSFIDAFVQKVQSLTI